MAPDFVFDQHDERSYRSVAIELLHDRRLPRIERDTGTDRIDPDNLHELLNQCPVHMTLPPQSIEHLKGIVWGFPFVIATVARYSIIDIYNGGNEAKLTEIYF